VTATGSSSQPAVAIGGRRRLWFVLLAGLLAVTCYWPITHFLDVRRFHAAQAAERARDFPRAQAELERCLRVWPDDPEVRLLAARVGWRSWLGRSFEAGWDRSLREHLKGADQAPGLSHRVSLESAILDLLGGDLRGAGARVQARVRDDNPDAVALLEALARAHLDSHHLSEASDFAGAILRQRPDHALAHFWRGLALELSGQRRGEADADYRRAVELEPDNFEFRLRLAGYLTLRREFLAETRDILEQLRAEQPDHPDVLQPLGVVLLDLGEVAVARPVVERLVALRPGDGEATALLGQLEMAAGQVPDAERQLRKAVAQSPGSHTAHVQLSQCLFRVGKVDEAKAMSERADRIQADRKAIAQLYGQVKDRPNDPRVRYDLGVLHRRVGDERVGAFWLRSALDVDQEFEPAKRALAERPGGGRP
jgi:tetratricopeptide (TPR) repeat protein